MYRKVFFSASRCQRKSAELIATQASGNQEQRRGPVGPLGPLTRLASPSGYELVDFGSPRDRRLVYAWGPFLVRIQPPLRHDTPGARGAGDARGWSLAHPLCGTDVSRG